MAPPVVDIAHDADAVGREDPPGQVVEVFFQHHVVDAQNGAVGDVWEFLEVGAHDAELKVPETLGGCGICS